VTVPRFLRWDAIVFDVPDSEQLRTAIGHQECLPRQPQLPSQAVDGVALPHFHADAQHPAQTFRFLSGVQQR